MDDKTLIIEAYKKMYTAMIAKDAAELNEILDNDFVLVHMTGMRQSKAEFIRAVENGTLNYYSADHQQIDIDINGDSAVLIGQSAVNAAVFGGGCSTWRLRLKLKLTKKADAWKMSEAKASTY